MLTIEQFIYIVNLLLLFFNIIIFTFPVSPVTVPAGIDLSWKVGPSSVGGLDEVIFECDVNTTGLDPQSDLLDVKFVLSGTDLKTFTALPYDQLPIQLFGTEFDTKYNEETHDEKLTYNKKVNYKYYN